MSMTPDELYQDHHGRYAGRTDTQRSLDEFQAVVDNLGGDQASTVGFVRIRVAVTMSLLIGLIGFIAGFLL
jgi:hypothetical protein